MHRRRFLAAYVISLGWPALLGAQAKPRRIGYLGVRSRSTPERPDPYYDAFARGLRELGYVEGKNIVVEWRFADNHYERLQPLAEELVRENLEVLATHSTPGTQALQRATDRIPIVFTAVGNPLELGIVQSLARPGGNVTGVANMTNEIGGKHVQLLRSLLPKTARAAVLFNPQNTTTVVILEHVQSAARQFGMQVTPYGVRRPDEIEPAFAQMAKARVEALIVAADALLIGLRSRIAELALRNRLPSVFPFSEDADAGGLASFGPNQVENYRRGATYVDKILRGAKAAEMPVEQPTQFELVVNMRTAAALGLSFPDSLLIRADRVVR